MATEPKPLRSRDPAEKAQQLAQDLLKLLDHLPGLDNIDRRRTSLRTLVTDLVAYRPPTPAATKPEPVTPKRRRSRKLLHSTPGLVTAG